MPDTIEIASRFCGPPERANGGYVAGRLAAHLSSVTGPVMVRLRRALPLETEIEVHALDRSFATLVHGGETLATAAPAPLDLTPPPARSFEAATSLSRAFTGFRRHPVPGCFVCGTARGEGDGLRIFPGPGRAGAVVGPWQPDASLDAGDGTVRPEHVWAALDCPGYFAATGDGRPMLLGQMTARLGRAVGVGERCVVLGWSLESEGRRHRVGTALYGEDGALCGLAEGIWIEPRAGVQSAATSASSSEAAGTEAA